MTLQQSTIIHGVFMNIFGVGTLVTGPSGIGKSDLALTLLYRGHQLIADDAPEFFSCTNNVLLGRAPETLRNLLEIRGIGIFNVLDLFGPSILIEEQTLSLVIQLENVSLLPRVTNPPLLEPKGILGVPVPHVKLPTANHRRSEILVETLVRYYKLQQSVINHSLSATQPLHITQRVNQS